VVVVEPDEVAVAGGDGAEALRFRPVEVDPEPVGGFDGWP
jgi:hypothetical protein